MKEKVNISEDSEFSGDSSQNYDSDISPENISRSISSQNEEDDSSEAESDIQHAHGQKQF